MVGSSILTSMINDPFPHEVFTGLFSEEKLRRAAAEVSSLPETSGWQRFRNEREFKDAITFEQARDIGCEAVWEFREWFSSPETSAWVSEVTGIPNLIFDGLGGGVHVIPAPGGLLDVHVDFNRDDQGRHRRVNTLLYLNENWDDPGGNLELWSGTDERPIERSIIVPPELGTMAMFVCSEHSWHGHPVPLQGNTPRKSLAAYYFTVEPPEHVVAPHSTRYV